MAKKTWIIVGGQLELRSFRKRCAGCRVSLLPGAHAEMAHKGLAKQIAAALRPFASQISNVIVVLDREGSEKIASELEGAIEGHVSRLTDIELCVVCPDRMIENWMLADVVAIKSKSYIRKTAKQKQYEGTHGKQELKKLFVGSKAYRETSHGVEMMCLVRSSQGSKNSPSFAKFMKALSDN